MAGDGVIMDPFLSAFRAPDLMEKLASFAEVRQHMADPGFIKQIEKLRDLATDPKLDVSDLLKTSAVSQQIARSGHNDPRIMQALMALQGQGLVVEDKDLKKAEDFGDMPRREPVQLEQMILVKDLKDASEAKEKGNEHFKKGDFAAALAHYEKGVELLRGSDEVSAASLATLLSNSAMAYLKLKWPDRAKKAASKAIRVIREAQDESFDQSKLFFRRALACEQLKELDLAVDDMLRALQQAKKSNLSLAEQHRMKGEVDRLKKLKTSHEAAGEKRRQERENEKEAEVVRMQGASLASQSDKKTDGGGQVAAPGGGSYITEQDFSHLATKKVTAAMKGIKHTATSGAKIEIVELKDAESKIEASITTKKGNRSLYYSMDLHLLWKGKASPQLKPKDGPSDMQGLIRVYNIAHDTAFKLGGDENTCYMYQLGWDQRMSGPWVEDLRTEAAELFDLVAARVDEVIEELRKK